MKHHTIKKIEIRVSRDQLREDGEVYNVKLASPECVISLTHRVTDGSEQESFLVFLLDVKNRVTGYLEVHRGSIDACSVDPRTVFRAAVLEGASGIIIAHNHPSGDPTPSEEDRTLTARLVSAGAILGVSILDHVIVGDGGGSYSFAEHGEMP